MKIKKKRPGLVRFLKKNVGFNNLTLCTLTVGICFKSSFKIGLPNSCLKSVFPFNIFDLLSIVSVKKLHNNVCHC